MANRAAAMILDRLMPFHHQEQASSASTAPN
jgi:hypothetical protein